MGFQEIQRTRALHAQFANVAASEPRLRVTYNSYLDVECHWPAILTSLFRHNTSGRHAAPDSEDYCVIALYCKNPGHGVVLGNRRARYTLIIVNWGDVHFDPCLRR